MTQEKRVYEEIAQLAENGRLPEANAKALALLTENAQDAEALFLLGFVFAKADNYGLAYQVLRRCVEITPNVAIAWHNLGKACYELNQREHAEQCWRRALQLEPTLASSLDGIGLIHLGRSEYDKCIEYCDRALAVDPEQSDTKVNRGMALLAQHRWREGWPGYDANVGETKDRKERTFGPEGKPVRWDGTKGLRMVVRADQGLGDELSFASCLPDLVRDAKSVVLECDRRTAGLFKRSFPGVTVYPTRYDEQVTWPQHHEFDARVLIGELPRFYRNTDADFPGTPYLKASPELRVSFRALLDHLGPRPKIGIAWTGGRPQTYSKRRSMSLDTLLPVLRQDAQFVALEYRTPDGKQKAEGLDPIAQEIEALREKHGIHVHFWPWAVQSYDYDVTMALLAELDLVISVTTTVVHAASALGTPVWCLTPERVMWRYGTPGAPFLWSRAVELWWQRAGDWRMNDLATKTEHWIRDFDSKRPGERSPIRQVA